MSVLRQMALRAGIALVGAAALVTGSVAVAQASPSPHTYATRYDGMGRVTGTIAPDPDGAGPLGYPATRTSYDQRGNPIRVETGELGSWMSEDVAPSSWGDFTVLTVAETAYDLRDRKILERVIGSDGIAVSLTQYSYDSAGRLECTAVRMNPAAYGSLPGSACTLGAEGSSGPDRITRTVYDAAGQVLQVRKAVGTSIEIADVTYSYTPSGKIAQVVDANGNRAELRYDGHDRQTQWVFPSNARPGAFDPSSPATALSTAGAYNDGDFEAYTYDANGNRTSLRKRDGSVITYQYDALNRVVVKAVPWKENLHETHRRAVHYGYDLRGLQLYARFDSPDGVGVTYSYDGFGRLLSETQNSDGNWRTVSSQYDANGNRVRVTWPDGGFVDYAQDGLDRFRAASWRDATAGSTLPFTSVIYNNRGQIGELNLASAATWFGYDPASRLGSLTQDFAGTSADVTWSYTRNAASQILSENRTNDSYAWDGHVNLTRPYTTNGLNQYENAGSAAFCYDVNGNLTADGSSVYLYDNENRLVQRRQQVDTNCAALSYTGPVQAELHYDPLGRLFLINWGATRFLYDGNAMVGEYSDSGAMVRRYIHGPNAEADDAWVQFEGPTMDCAATRFYHTDPRGSVVALADCSGNNQAINSYDEYGIPDTATGNDIATKGRFRYTGQAWIPELGMYYYKARIYSPTLGRFLQTDPIGYEDQFNLYAYVANDPINGVDPTGKFTCVDNGNGTQRCTSNGSLLDNAALAAYAAYVYADQAIRTILSDDPASTPSPNPSTPTPQSRTAASDQNAGDTSEMRSGGGGRGRRSGPGPYTCTNPPCGAAHGGVTGTTECPDCDAKRKGGNPVPGPTPRPLPLITPPEPAPAVPRPSPPSVSPRISPAPPPPPLPPWPCTIEKC